ncbi:MAG: pseudouridine synthase [Myxococcales bacterium]
MNTSSEPSALVESERVVCVHAERCGGCPAIRLPYDEQLAFKRARHVQSLARYPSLEFVYTEPVLAADPVVAYRRRAKLVVAPGGQVGLFAKGGGHQVVDIPTCRVLSPPLARVADVLRERIANDAELIPYDPDGVGVLRAVDLREVCVETSKVLVSFVVQRSRVTSVESLRLAAQRLAEAAPEVIGVAANYHEGELPQILGSDTVLLYGASRAPDRVGHSVHHATFGSFVQVHRGQAARVHSMLADAFGIGQGEPTSSGSISGPRVLDLYGGSGAIALGLATLGARVHLVESFAPAVAQADAAACEQRLNLTTECSDVAIALRAIALRGERFDGAVVNPPRRGMSAMAREGLARLEPHVIGYVSCDPDTLARDLDHFARLGYKPTSIRPLDMIPLTDEVEAVAILRRAPPTATRVVFEDDEILVVDKSPHEPVLPQDDYLGSLLGRVQRLVGAEQAVPVQRIDVGTSGLVLFVRRPDLAARWTEVLSGPLTRRIYVAGARGVTPSKGAITRELRDEGHVVAARTRYRRLAIAAGHSVLRVIPEPGRTHQIRRHLAAIGHPVLGDDRYGHPPTNRFFEEKHALDRPFLHCVRLEFDHPSTGVRHHIDAALAGDLRAVIERTSGPGTLRFLDHKGALGTGGNSSLPPAPNSRP